MVEVRNRWTDEVICTGETIKGAVQKNLADLRGADLSGADLSGADLRGADLRGAKIAWQSHDLFAEILKRAAGDDIAKLKVSGLILIQREWCWREFIGLRNREPLADWALGVLADLVQDGDGAPDVIREIADSRKRDKARDRQVQDAPTEQTTEQTEKVADSSALTAENQGG